MASYRCTRPVGTPLVLAGPQLRLADDAVIVLEEEPQPPRVHEDRLVLDLVPLQGQPPARLDDQDLADVAVGVGPDELVAPRLVDPPRGLVSRRHEPRTRASPATSNASRNSGAVASVYTRTSGSVPDARISSHEPSARKNLYPSPVSSATVWSTGFAGQLRRRVGGQVDEEPSLDIGVVGAIHVDIDAPIERRARDLVEVLHGHRHRPAAGRPLTHEQVEEQQVRVDPVPLGQVHPEAEPARLLGPHHRAGLDHPGTDELESDRGLVGLDPVSLAQAGRHGRVVDADHDRVAPAAMLGEVVHQEPRDLELVDEGPPLVRGPGAVRVAVEQESQVVRAIGEEAERLIDVRTDRFGIDATEIRVALLVDLVDPDPPACQVGGSASPTRPPTTGRRGR